MRFLVANTSEEKVLYARRGLDYRLHFGGSLAHWSRDILQGEGHEHFDVAIAVNKHEGRPFGHLVRRKNLVSIFVDPNHRRKGIGTGLLAALQEVHPIPIHHHVGQRDFFKHVSLTTNAKFSDGRSKVYEA